MSPGARLALLAALGAAVGGAAVLLMRKAPPPSAPGPCCGQPVCGNGTRHPISIPAPWRRATGAEAAAYAATARQILGAHYADPFGTLVPIDATTAAIVEQHCHEPGGAVKPWGYHTGITLLKRA